MTTMVFHSSSLGVTEYARDARGLAGDFECTSDDLLLVSGAADLGAPVVARFGLGIDADASRLQKFPERMYVQVDCAGPLAVDVLTAADRFSYVENVGRDRNRRFVFGRGIRDPYLGYELYNPGGDPFVTDSIEFGDRASGQRKV